MKSIQAQSIGLVAALLFSCVAGAQEKGTTAAVAQQLPAAAPAQATNAVPDAPKKKRVAKRAPKPACTKLDDPWDNMCNVQKKAALACQDLPEAKKVVKRARKGEAPPAPGVNQRQQCIESYMRNV